MANCEAIYALKGISSELCEGNVGGIKTAYIALKSDVTITTNKTTSTATVTGSGKFYAYEFRKNTSTFTSTLNADADNATQYWTTEAVLQFKKTEAAKRSSVMALCQNDVVVVIEDNNGVHWVLGADNAVTATAGNQTMGTNRSDSNHYEITLTDESNELPFVVEDWKASDMVATA
jgi:hypothetical protein